jgi:IMP dehydrogenase
MQSFSIKESISFDDVLLVPKYSEVESRSSVDLSVKVKKKNNEFVFSMPIVPANMKTVTGSNMAKYIAKRGGLALLHRFMSAEEQINIIKDIFQDPQNANHVGLSIGVKPEDKETLDRFICNGVKIICLDIAHAHSSSAIRMCEHISSNYKDVLLIAGNVATGSAAESLWMAGADIVKVGVGSGSICTTRIETGNGVPQLSAIMDVELAKRRVQSYLKGSKHIYFMSDGGIKIPADVCKALCFADMVMAGNIFAGTDEAPGDIIDIDGHAYKSYVGSSTHKDSRKEGVEALVPYKGPTEKILTRFLEGLQSCCSYQGVSSVCDLKINPEFVKITNSGLIESHPHDVRLKK